MPDAFLTAPTPHIAHRLREQMIKAGEWDKGYLEHGNGLTGNPLTFDYAYKVQTHTHVQTREEQAHGDTQAQTKIGASMRTCCIARRCQCGKSRVSDRALHLPAAEQQEGARQGLPAGMPGTYSLPRLHLSSSAGCVLPQGQGLTGEGGRVQQGLLVLGKGRRTSPRDVSVPAKCRE